MSIRNLHLMFAPRSVAVIGASDRSGSVGATVFRNMREGGFSGPIYALNRRHRTVMGERAYADVAQLPQTPDLAVIATPPPTLPGLIRALGERGTRAAVVITGGVARARDDQGNSIVQAMRDAARPYLLRILGPNCVGLLVPGIGLNASFAHTTADAGGIAFVSQSGGLTTAVLDSAKLRGIGFSHFISLGDAADVDFGDVIDYLASDPQTRAILLYAESIGAARKFMSASRAAARNKPVLVVKAGRAPEGARAAASHTGALAGADDVYDAALRRAGMLRVNTIQELFDTVQTLARAQPVAGKCLAIMTNGGGPAVMAADALSLAGGTLAALSPQTIARLDAALPVTWSHGNPVDIVGDASTPRYVAALSALLDDDACDAVLFIYVPTAITVAQEIARACAPLAKGKRVLACWLGVDAVAHARRFFEAAGIPCYDTPEQAVAAFLQLANYQRNQQLLMEIPPSMSADFTSDVAAARAAVTEALAAGRAWLSEREARRVLAAYRIPVVRTQSAANVDDAVNVAAQIGFPVALKIDSPQVTHKSDVGGVALNLANAEEVRHAAQAMARRLTERAPHATLAGFTVQEMIVRPNAVETIAGAAVDSVFGPVMLFGQGGVAVEVVADRAMALPPLNLTLAADLISRTRVSKLLQGYRDRPPVKRGAVELALVQLSQLMVDIADIAEIDINPLLADEKGVIALDARIRVTPAAQRGSDRLAIRPYPNELGERVNIAGRDLVLRPIRPEDAPAHARFLDQVDAQDLQMRFFHAVRTITGTQLARFTQIDYDREMAFIASADDGTPHAQTLGVVRTIANPDNTEAEFAILVRSDLKGRGLGTRLMQKIIAYSRARGTGALTAITLRNNDGMLALARECGFALQAGDEPGVVALRLKLQDAAPPA
ncbi:MAG: bifunctional acetate--CoA ligase family protein/GNAT family N-acetyltransferase [Betaproteobacteria bacterium]|nr:bifunctional acetate--CoA ligase family protein/GNAT family N-acetyltransferase [Betaproteobacteria bacterium]